MKIKTRSPLKCVNVDQVCQLRTDHHDTTTHWIITDGFNVSLVEQKDGEPSKESIKIPRKVFNALVRWYVRPQPILQREKVRMRAEGGR